MKAVVLDQNGQRTWALVFDKGDELMTTLNDFAQRERIDAAHFTAIGAFSEATLGYFDRERREYRRIPVREQVEVLTLAGDIALEEGRPKVHAHVVLGKADGTAHGGHVLDARVWPTLELVLVDSPRALTRRSDPATGLALIDVGALSRK
jgi:predicted DNA-binding protein with PD1-like motif